MYAFIDNVFDNARVTTTPTGFPPPETIVAIIPQYGAKEGRDAEVSTF
jgi:hypothetical protein